MLEVKTVDQVFQIIKGNFSGYGLKNERVNIKNGLGRITAVDILPCEDIPGFNRSSVDGYAVISSDTFGASEAIPAQLEYAGEVRMGVKPDFPIVMGHTVYVPTGGELPEGADSVIMVEYTEDYNDGYIYMNKASAPGNNVVFAGDDVKKGSVVIKAGTRLRPQDIGALAAMGYSEIEVKKKIKVAVISTGDEVVDIDQKVEGSKVRDVNSYALYSGVLACGAEPLLYGIVGDNFDRIKQVVEKAAAECDVVLISGGSSVGNKDETFNVINTLGAPGVLVHGIAVKPGKPTIIGKAHGKAIIGLPGHPASAYVIFKIFVSQLLEIMNGIDGELHNMTMATMAYNYPSNNGREEFLPVRLEKVDGISSAVPVLGKSGLITLLTQANGLVHIARGSEGLMKGQKVLVRVF